MHANKSDEREEQERDGVRLISLLLLPNSLSLEFGERGSENGGKHYETADLQLVWSSAERR